MTAVLGTSTSTLCLWRPPESSITVFARAGLDAVRARLEPIDGLDEALVHATLVEPPRRSLVPFRRAPVALVTLRGPDASRGAARAALRTLPGRLEAWAAQTSVPMRRASDRRTAASLLTLFRRAAHIDGATFLARWHGEHTPLALEIHPAIGYVRHVVAAALEPSSTPWDSIVTEDFAALEDLTTLRLFGRGPRALVNAVRTLWHVRTFLDTSSLEAYLVHERRVR